VTTTRHDHQLAGAGDHRPARPTAPDAPARPADRTQSPTQEHARPPAPPAPRSAEHGARSVPVSTTTTQFTLVTAAPEPDPLPPVQPPDRLAPLPDQHRHVLALARRPVRGEAIVPIIGSEGGIGRTTITRALAAAFRRIRGEDPVLIDAVPISGALTAAADQPTDYSVADLATMPWPIPPADLPPMLNTVDGLPTLTSADPARGVLNQPRTLLTAVTRIATLAPLALIDTVADVAGSPNRELVRNHNAALVWVASASRAGLWGIAEALTYHQAIGAQQVAQRSVLAVIGNHRRWPADAAAAEAQLTGIGVQTVRIPRSAKPLSDPNCQPSIDRLLAAVIQRCA
jgi:MinD-like ATPase involved in chromosome partitioning or flagellar assembly